MARSGPEGHSDVSIHDAYRFESRAGDKVEGFVYKRPTRRQVWEALIRGTATVATGETRREAIEAALAEQRKI